MTQQASLPDTQEDEQEPNAPSPRGIARLVLCLFLIIMFLAFFKNSDAFQILGVLLTILGINLFEPVFGAVDRADLIFWQALLRMQLFTRLVMFSHIPGVGRHIKRRSRIFIPILTTILILYLFFHTFIGNITYAASDFSCLSTPLPIPSALCNTGIGISTLPDGVRFGLITSANQGPFDLSNLNGEEKQVELAISQENRTACTGAHITLAEVTILSRTIEDPSDSAYKGLNDLRGAYLAQHDYNATKASYDPNAHQGRPFVSLCLIIANLGTLVTADQNSGALYTLPQVVKQLVQFNRYDPTFRGIIGFPYSAQAEEAVNEFPKWWGKQAVPIVSPSATSYKLSNVPNFYRTSSPDETQAGGMALFVCNALVQKVDLPSVDIFYNSDPYSSSLSSTFGRDITTCISSNRVHYEPYENGDAASIQKAAQNAVEQHYSFIFFPGYESDLDTLQTQIQRSMLGASSSTVILGGDGLDDIVNPNHNTFVPVYKTVYATPLADDDPANLRLIQEYTDQNFSLPYLEYAVPSYTLLPQDVIRSYNAAKAFTSTLGDLADHDLDTTQDKINTHLASITFNGIGGQFGFQGDAINSGHISDPQFMLVYIMCMGHDHIIHLVATYNGNNLSPAQGQCS